MTYIVCYPGTKFIRTKQSRQNNLKGKGHTVHTELYGQNSQDKSVWTNSLDKTFWENSLDKTVHTKQSRHIGPDKTVQKKQSSKNSRDKQFGKNRPDKTVQTEKCIQIVWIKQF